MLAKLNCAGAPAEATESAEQTRYEFSVEVALAPTIFSATKVRCVVSILEPYATTYFTGHVLLLNIPCQSLCMRPEYDSPTLQHPMGLMLKQRMSDLVAHIHPTLTEIGVRYLGPDLFPARNILRSGN